MLTGKFFLPCEKTFEKLASLTFLLFTKAFIYKLNE